jgi:hypothetical protein
MRYRVTLEFEMKRTFSLVVVIVMFLGALANDASSQLKQRERSTREWRAATYHALTVGSSTRADMYRVFGKPKRADTFKEDHEVWYIYEGKGELPGELTVMVDASSKRIIGMYLIPSNLSKEAAIKHFGQNYRLTKYDFCPGFDDAESAPIYESTDGAAAYIEYRNRGIAIMIGDQEMVYHVMYVNKALGRSSKSMCGKRATHNRRRA